MANSIMPSVDGADVGKPRRALVTGGAVRLGRAIALALADAGMDVAIGYGHSTREAGRTVAAIEERGARGLAIRANLADPTAGRRLVRQAARELGGLEVLVNNAAIFRPMRFEATTPAAYDAVLALNLRAPFFCSQAAAALMGAAGGHIVNVGDAAGERPLPRYIPYALSKVALVALTRNLAVALEARRIAVNCVAPGPVLRPPWFPPARWSVVTRRRPLRVEEVAAVVRAFATCPRSITGQTLAVGGEMR
jgi:NAD(P)-dependent dehydrogenase (short-subunit alcohol dehydrogenase family)